LRKEKMNLGGKGLKVEKKKKNGESLGEKLIP